MVRFSLLTIFNEQIRLNIFSIIIKNPLNTSNERAVADWYKWWLKLAVLQWEKLAAGNAKGSQIVARS